MHILHITPYFAPAWAYGGPVRVVYEIARRAAARGHTVTLLTTDALDAAHRAPTGEEWVEGIRVLRLPNLSNTLAWRRIFLPRGFKRALRTCLPSVDVVHMHEFRSMLNAQALQPLLRQGIPYVLSPQGGLPRELGRSHYKVVFDALYGRRLLAHAAALHAIAPLEEHQYAALGFTPERVVTIPNGIDPVALPEPDLLAFRARFAIPPRSPVIGFVGRLNAIKGVHVLVEAFALLHSERPDALLMLVGPDDGARPALEARVAALGMADHVRFIGYLGDDESKAAAYRICAACVLPSRYEGLGITALEALLNGVPTVVSDRVGAADLDELRGLLAVFPYGDAPALAGHLNILLSNPEPAQVLAARAREVVSTHLNWDALTERWLLVYNNCLERPAAH